MQPDPPRRPSVGMPRDERVSLDVIRRVMPKTEPVEIVPRDPTLLEELTGSFYTEQEKTAKDVSARIKDDGKRR
jgi:hypothetical protein